MSDDYQRIELITGTARRRRWTMEQKLRIIEASYAPGESVSSLARRHEVAPNLLYRWRRLMAEGGVAAVGSRGPLSFARACSPVDGTTPPLPQSRR
jgi:transposase